MSFEEWLESDAVVNNFGHVINFSNTAVEFARAAWLASREAAQHGVQSDACLLGGKHEWRTLSNGEYTKVVCGKCAKRR